MSIRKHICKVLGIILLILSGCSIRELPSSESSSSLESVSVSSSAAPEVSPASSEILPVSSESGEVLPEEDILVPEVELLEFEDIDFTAMTEDELKEVLGKVLDKAFMLCQYGYAADGFLGGKFGKVDFTNPEQKIIRPFDDNPEGSFYLWEDCPYQSIEELRQDMLTVFPVEVVETKLSHVFHPLIDNNGKIYIYSGISGYSDARRWNLDEIKVISVLPHECTVSMPVAHGWGDKESTSSLTVYFEDNHIKVANYFDN